MPAMIDRVTTLGFGGEAGDVDPTNIDDLIDFLLNGGTTSSVSVAFSDTLPPGTNRYSVPVTALHFEPEGVATPSASPLPFLPVTHVLGNNTSTGNYVLDTGCSVKHYVSGQAGGTRARR